MEVRPYVPSDFLELHVQPLQPGARLWQTPERAVELASSGEAWTARASGQVVACVGLIPFWPGRRFVWAVLAADAGRHLVALTWRVRRWLRYHGDGRIEAAIDPEWLASVRWAERLGFQREGRMREYVPGKDYDLYARIGR